MFLPQATYRVQFSHAFTFSALKKIIPYLRDLGITTIYASPVFQARPGSDHGYDIVDPHRLNSEIGSLDEFRDLNRLLKQNDISWLQDIVPNHMAYHADNSRLWDMLEKGPSSNYYHYFDVNWEENDPEINGKIMAPFLGALLEEAIANREIKLAFTEQGFIFKYYEQAYPMNCSGYFALLHHTGTHPKGKRFLDVLEKFKDYEQIVFSPPAWKDLKDELYKIVQNDPKIEEFVNGILSFYNNDTAQLKQLLQKQYFFLCHWKTTEQQINYRRFFTINDLICLKMEEEKVFDDYHGFIKQLWDEDLIQGLRIDHVDGLFEPEEYLKNLRKLIGKNGYLIVEKILEMDEALPAEWPVQGASGYEFLALVNALYTDTANQGAFSKLYKTVAPRNVDYDILAYKKKQFILWERLGGELNNLIKLLQKLELPVEEERLKKALAAFLAAFPVYRTYITQWPIAARDREVLQQAFDLAKEQEPEFQAALNELKKALIDYDLKDERKDWILYFLQKCQQVTSPLAAKGIEDTTFYVYNRLIAHNEVGASPNVFGLTTGQFHDKLQQRLLATPHALNATATHDTKRGEDVRTCLNVLSEIPNAWEEHTRKWISINEKFKSRINDQPVPGDNEEYFLYQTLIGVVPLNGAVNSELISRIKDYMIKVIREAKIHTSWSEPDENYEQKVRDFIESILQDKSFKEAFIPFLKTISHYGAIYSLAQVLLKVTAPGIPDIYQGNELWDLSMVDPDNRRPVDYILRAKHLKELQEKEKENLPQLINELKQTINDGRIKLFTLYKSLHFRKDHADLFAYGKYFPLKVEGENSSHVIGYARQHGRDWCLTIITNRLTLLIPQDCFPEDEAIWENAILRLPEDAPEEWEHIFTGKKYRLRKTFALSEVYHDFPVVLLYGES